jgi:hypothetical protein
MKQEKQRLESLAVTEEGGRQKVKESEPVSLCNTHSLLLNSTNTPCSPHTRIPPDFYPRVSRAGGKVSSHFSVSITRRFGHREGPTLQEAL